MVMLFLEKVVDVKNPSRAGAGSVVRRRRSLRKTPAACGKATHHHRGQGHDLETSPFMSLARTIPPLS
jgi:hypothetical protein